MSFFRHGKSENASERANEQTVPPDAAGTSAGGAGPVESGYGDQGALEPGGSAGVSEGSARGAQGAGGVANMLPGRERRRFGVERLLTRLVATSGIIGIGVALGAILASSKVQGWITGLVVAVVSVVLSAVLWSSRQL